MSEASCIISAVKEDFHRISELIRSKLAKISIEVILMIVTITALINGYIVIKDVLDHNTAVVNSMISVNDSLVNFEKLTRLNITALSSKILKMEEELDLAEKKFQQLSALEESVKRLNETVEKLIRNSCDGLHPSRTFFMFIILLSLLY